MNPIDTLAEKIREATRTAALEWQDLDKRYREAAKFQEGWQRLQAETAERLEALALALREREAGLIERDREIADLRAQRDQLTARLAEGQAAAQQEIQAARDRAGFAENRAAALEARMEEFAAHPTVKAERLARLQAEHKAAQAEAKARAAAMKALEAQLQTTPTAPKA